MRRMLGMDDGISDGLFRFSRPLTGCYFWCPPVCGGKLDLTVLGSRPENGLGARKTGHLARFFMCSSPGNDEGSSWPCPRWPRSGWQT
jgi:hypothetical protein